MEEDHTQNQNIDKQEGVITIWTDGSLNEGKLGSAAVFTITTPENKTEIIKTVKTSQKYGKPSSTTAEIFAIYSALELIHKEQEVIIKTDSQAAIEGIISFQKNKLNIRKQLKLTSYPIQTAIHQIMSGMNIKPTFIHVPAHTGLEYNELADKLAKEATTLTKKHDVNQSLTNNMRVLHEDDHRTEEYPTNRIQKSNHKNNYIRLLNKK